MSKFKRNMIWGSCFFLIACTNISQFCRHTTVYRPFFNFNQHSSNGFMYTNASELLNKPVWSDRDLKTQSAAKITWNTLADIDFENVGVKNMRWISFILFLAILLKSLKVKKFIFPVT